MADSARTTRRSLLSALLSAPLAAPLAASIGCRPRSDRLPPAGEIIGPDRRFGHRLRDLPPPAPSFDAWRDVDVVIVGGGVAGFSAARRLLESGCDDFVLCELEPRPGGTSAGDSNPLTEYPWGAHYLPLPLKSNEPLVEFLKEAGVVVGSDGEGEPIPHEECVCRPPQERLFLDGTWRSDLDPLAGASSDERTRTERDLRAFEAEIDRWVARRDAQGRRAFASPIDSGAVDDDLRRLDRLTFAEWLDARGWTSPRFRWLVDYECRDDYGLRADQTSAWAGLFYSASRKRRPGAAPQPLLTWPSGNRRLVDHLQRGWEERLRLRTMVWRVAPSDDPVDGRCQVVAQSTDSQEVFGWRARRVICATPQFVNRRILQGYDAARRADLDEFQYGSWLVANLHLHGRPVELDAPLAWDNVLYDSPSLGYVAATHQTGSDYGPTVWTYYLPFCGDDPRQERRRLDELTWAEAAEIVLQDLERAHPDLRDLVDRLDVMRWGHAMIRPTPGFITGTARQNAARPWRGAHFANTDLSGAALFEEAFAQGRRAAEEVLAGWRKGGSHGAA